MKCPHCDTPIDEHEANRCLDAWVAEAVMGYSIEGDYLVDSDGRGVEFSNTIPYNYSTDIAAAWEVVEKMEQVNIFGPRAKWIVEFLDDRGNHYGDPLDRPTRADTAQLAICRAALKAVHETQTA